MPQKPYMPEISREKEARIKRAARHALNEAASRRREARPGAVPKELGGRDGPDPARFGDWEKKGVASDF